MVIGSESAFVIAEAGVNHNGCIERAKTLIEAAAAAGADAIKFQTFSAKKLLTPAAPKADYQLSCTDEAESQFDMIQSLELSDKAHRLLLRHCGDHNIEFLSSAFDVESLDYLYDLGVRTFKVPSGELTNLPYLRNLSRVASEVLLSTGMACYEEVEAAVGLLLGSGIEREQLVVLQCHTEYPTAMEDVNLRAMRAMGDQLNVQVGYSDHTIGMEVAIAAVALGARVIEKHFTLDRNLPGPDHKASIESDELARMIQSIRNVETALGSDVKQPTKKELANRAIVRKSIYAACPIKKGETLTEKAVCVKRPGDGVSAMLWDQVIGSQAGRDYELNDRIELET